MKTTINSWILLLFVMAVEMSFGQNYNFDEELKRMLRVPNTPEAAAFEKYGSTPVDMYTGKPNISIPIYTIQGKELNLPISLSYDASGVKVGQLATGVGLSWNLNAGGRISRTVNGIVDDIKSISNGYLHKSVYSTDTIYFQGDSIKNKPLKDIIEYYKDPPQVFETQQQVEDYFQFLKDVSDNKLDTQPDYFSFSALGISDHFVYDMENDEFVALNNPRIKATAVFNASPEYITNWIVTGEDGTKFYFDQAETTKVINPDTGSQSTTNAVVQNYNSSWVLTKIVSPNGLDTFEFEYDDFNNILIENQPWIKTSSVTNELDHDSPNSTAATNVSTQYTEYKLSQLALVKVKHNTKTIIDISLKSRSDFGVPSAIDQIDIKNFANSGIVKRFKLHHSYFGTASSNAYSQRLKLDSIQIKSTNNTLSSYVFDYFSPQNVPTRASLSQDFLGLYNGKNNTDLYPAVTISGISFDGADRSPDFNKAIIGTMKKITYPTGGYTEFLFEPNKTPYMNEDITASVQDVTYANISVNGNGGSSSACGACCIDQYGNTPDIDEITFNITEAGHYEIDYTNDSGSSAEAYLFKRSSIVKSTPMPTIPYDQVVEQSSCNELVNMIWTHYTGPFSGSIYLDVGVYQITMAKGVNQSSSATATVRIHREEVINNSTVGTGEVNRAGFRISTIKDYNHDDTLVKEKEYIYRNDINSSTSSGIILFKPTFYTTHQYTMHSETIDYTMNLTQGINTRNQLRRGSSWSGGYRPYIAYATVIEKEKGGLEKNGHIKHIFNTGVNAGVFSTGVSPNVNLYRKDFGVGQKNGAAVYKNIGTSANIQKVSSEGTQFFSDRYFGNTTLYVYNNPTRNFQYVRIYQGANNKFYYDYVDAKFTGFGGPYAPGTAINPAPPAACDLPNKCLTLEYSTFQTRLTYAQGRAGGVSAKSSKRFFDNDSISTYQKSIYDSSSYLLKELRSSTTHNDTLTTKYYYPQDYAGTTVYDQMITKNMLNVPIKTESYKKVGATETKLSTQETSYKYWGAGIYKPELVKTAKGTASLQERMKVHSYDNGYPKEVSQTNGAHTVYLWGYNKQYLVAKIENATYSEIEALPYFGSNFIISQGLNPDQENSLLDNLPNAMVTIYRYTDPHIGVSSIRDANGNTVSYEYDEFNRLKRVKDTNGKIISENNYNYKN